MATTVALLQRGEYGANDIKAGIEVGSGQEGAHARHTGYRDSATHALLVVWALSNIIPNGIQFFAAAHQLTTVCFQLLF